MMTDFECFINELIKDYFTANIKAEVPIDTLITPIISDICRETLGETILLTKEMPIVKVERIDKNKDSRSLSCCNADFVLLSKEKEIVYIVELKTSESSEKEEQLINYKDKINGNGDKFGNLLIDLFDILYRHSLNGNYDNLKAEWENKNLDQLVRSVLEIDESKLKSNSNIKGVGNVNGRLYTECAEIYLRMNEIHKMNKDSSEKYMMTAARLLDALKTVNIALEKIAKYNMELVYILPNGVAEVPNVKNIYLGHEEYNPTDNYGKAVKKMFSRLWNK